MKILKFVMCILGGIVLSLSFWFALFIFLPLPITFIIAPLILIYLYWPKERWLFSKILGPILLLEFLLFLTISLII